jgi:hypothetical protein
MIAKFLQDKIQLGCNMFYLDEELIDTLDNSGI